MTPTDVAELLTTLHAAYPSAPLEADTAAVWFQHLERFDRLDAEAACYRVIDTERFMPTIAVFVAACQTEADQSRRVELATQRPAVLEPGEADVAEDVHRSFVAACRAALEVAQTGGGADAAQAAFDAHAPTRFAGPGRTYPCRCGPGEGWVEEPSGRVRPCSDCRPEMHALWVGGHLASGHVCHECRDRKRGAA